MIYKLLFLVFMLACAIICRVDAQSLPDWSECPEFKNEKQKRIVIVVDASSKIRDYSMHIAKDEIEKSIFSIHYNRPVEIIITELGKDDRSNKTTPLRRPDTGFDQRPLACSPECNKFIESCISETEYEQIKKKYEEKIKIFQTELEDRLNESIKTPPTDNSPILQTLKLLDIGDKIFDELWVVSDMLENASIIDMYDLPIPIFEDIKNKIEQVYGFPEKKGSTTVFLLNRCGDGGEIQKTNPFKSFWEDYFSHVTDNKPIWKYIPSGPCESEFNSN